METEITTELLQTIYKRAQQFSIAMLGKEPDEIEICEDGDIKAIFSEYHCGEYSEDSVRFNAEDLSSDLDAVADERIKKEKKEEEERIELNRLRLLENERRAKQERKEQFERLKKEFES